jgi:hypothetical protein
MNTFELLNEDTQREQGDGTGPLVSSRKEDS